MAELYKELSKTTLLNKSKLIEYLVKYDIFANLPTLSKNECELFDLVKIDLPNIKENKRKFYDKVKKAYINFIELGYLNQELLYELYTIKLATNELVSLCKISSVTYYSSQILEDYNDSDSKEFKVEVTKFLKGVDANNENIGSDFACPKEIVRISLTEQLSNNEIMKACCKYDERLDSECLIIDINIQYSKIYEDIYSIVLNKKKLNHIIIKFKSRASIDPLTNITEDLSETDWQFRTNNLLYVVLKLLNSSFARKLYSVKLAASEECITFLDSENMNLLCDLLNSNHLSLLSLQNIKCSNKEAAVRLGEALVSTKSVQLFMYDEGSNSENSFASTLLGMLKERKAIRLAKINEWSSIL